MSLKAAGNHNSGHIIGFGPYRRLSLFVRTFERLLDQHARGGRPPAAAQNFLYFRVN
jgi:hypothetical protein